MRRIPPLLLHVLFGALLFITPAANVAGEGQEPSNTLRVVFRLEESPEPAVPLPARLRLLPATRNLSEPTPSFATLELAVSIPGEAEIAVPAGSEWVAHLESPRLWMAPRWLDRKVVEPLELRARRVGELVVPLSRAGEDTLPTSAEASFTPSSLAAGPESGSWAPGGPRGSTSCTISEGSARCVLPMGLLDLRLEPPDTAPIYLWKVRITPDDRVVLPPVRLVRGASLSGWVLLPKHDADPAKPAKPVKIEVMPRVQARSSSTELRESLAVRTVKTKAAENGFFQVVGLEAGAYALRISMDGMAPARRFPIWISGNGEEKIETPIELGPPSELRVSLDPPVDPSGGAWKLSLQRESEVSENVTEVIREGSTAPDGNFQTENLPPGSYVVSVESGDGTHWLEEPFRLESGESRDLFIPVPLVEVVGTVKLGRKPIQGRLSFVHRGLGAMVKMPVEEGGEFRGFLPSEGEWGVRMRPAGDRADGSRAQLLRATVVVQRSPGDREAELEIVFPATRVGGQVVDGAGVTVPEAVVTAWTSDETTAEPIGSTRTDEGGRFTLVGLPTGPVILEAQAGSGARTGPTRLHLAENLPLDSLVLVVRETLTIEAHLTSSGRPVPYAAVRARITDPTTGTLLSLWATTATSDATGRVVLRVPEGDLDLLVHSPSCATTLLALPAPRLRELVKGGLGLELASGGGTLLFDVGAVLAEGDSEAPGRILVYHGGGSATLEELLRVKSPAMVSPAAFAIELMDPGTYTVCQVWPDGHTACSDGLLVSGGELGFSLEGREGPGEG